MTTIAKDFASKAAVAFVAAAMIFSAFAPAAQAQTTADLQKMIDDLMAQIEALKGGSTTTGGSSAAGVCPFTWTRDLRTGSTGADVKALQQLLNSDPDTRVAATGAGSAGMETETFGPMTAAAVSKMQVKYRADILTPNGLVNPTGTFGPSSRAKANSLCAAAPAPGGDEDEDEDDEDSENMELQGEGTLETFEMDDADDTEMEEGTTDEVIAEITMEASDGDIEVDRMTFTIVGQSTPTEADPWDVFEAITLWVDGEQIAEFDSSDEDAYLDEDAGEFRFSGLNLVLAEDEEVEVQVGASFSGDIDGAGSDANWRLTATEVRYFDADGVSEDDDTTDELPTAAADFEVVEEGADDELTVKSSSEDPKATTLELEDDSKSDMMTVFAYTLDTDDSDNDIEVTQIRVDVDGVSPDGVTPTSTAVLIDDAQLLIDGQTYDDVTITHGTTGQFLFDIENEELVIEAGEQVTVEFQVEFKALSNSLSEGSTIQASTDATVGYDAEGGDDLSGSQFSGSATGDEHTLRTEGAVLELVEFDELLKENTDATTTDDEGVYTLEFEVTAFNGDLYIDDTAVRGVTLGTEGVNFVVVTNGATTTAGTAVPTLDSDAQIVGGRYKVDEGSTETFTLTVEYDPAATGSFKVQLYSVNYKVDTNGAPDAQQLALPDENFDTDSLTI